MIKLLTVTSSDIVVSPQEHHEFESRSNFVSRLRPPSNAIDGKSLSRGNRHHSGGGIGRCDTLLTDGILRAAVAALVASSILTTSGPL
jgi:hypothetical protein